MDAADSSIKSILINFSNDEDDEDDVDGGGGGTDSGVGENNNGDKDGDGVSGVNATNTTTHKSMTHSISTVNIEFLLHNHSEPNNKPFGLAPLDATGNTVAVTMWGSSSLIMVDLKNATAAIIERNLSRDGVVFSISVPAFRMHGWWCCAVLLSYWWSCMVVLHGGVALLCCMVLLHGGVTWWSCMVLLHGGVA